MEVGFCTPRSILQPCELEGHAYQVDAYVGCEHNCCYCYAVNDAESNGTKRILIHDEIVRRLAEELEGVPPQSIYIGMNSDPYQPAETAQRQTRAVLELLAERTFTVCVLTKSPQITRDLDLFSKMDDPYLGFSIAFQNEDERRLFEECAPPNAKRLSALATLRAAGIRTYALICPVMPYISDVEAIIELAAPHVDHIYVYRLRMEAETDANWQNVKRVLDRLDPALTARYRRIAFDKNDPYWRDLSDRLHTLRPPSGVKLSIEV